MRYVVTAIVGMNNVPYYVVTDRKTGKGVEGYGCSTWADHRANELNKGEPDEGFSTDVEMVSYAHSKGNSLSGIVEEGKQDNREEKK